MPKEIKVSKARAQPRMSKAALKYDAGPREEVTMSTISSKNQITLPAHLLREIGLRPGDRLAVTREGNRLVLRARPRDWVKYHAGALAGLYGQNQEEADAYLEELRTDAERDEAIERAWSGPESRPL